MNKVCLIGRLTKDPEVRYTQSNNTMVVSFNLAVNRRFTKENEERQADFISIVAWSKTAEFVSKYFKKGQQVGIVGRIQTRNWDDEQGQKHYATEVIAEEVYFADTKRDAEVNPFAASSGAVDAPFNPATAPSEFTPVTDDDLPF